MKLLKYIKDYYWVLFGSIGDQWFIYWKEKRRRKAIKIAHEMSENFNGRRYFVLENDSRPGHYVIRNWDEIKAMQKAGIFDKNAKFTDFLKEAAYYTPSKVNFYKPKK